MAFCTGKYCLCLFKIVMLICLIMLFGLVITYVFFGNMPPSFTMAIGFWLLLYTNFLGIYLLLLSEATFRRDEDIYWINKLTQIGLTVCSCCFALGGVLFVIPITAESMMSFCKLYIKLYGDIPPFLDLMQKKYKCCGVYSYLDYGRKGFHAKNTKPGGYGSDGFNVYRMANPNDDFFHELIQDLTLNRTVARRTTGLDIPQSCCKTWKALDPHEKDCGKRIEYTGATIESAPVHYHKQTLDAVQRVNDHTMGCFEKYDNIKKTGQQFQLTYFIFVVTLMSFLQCVFFAVILWFHRMALKTIRQLHFWIPELQALNEASELLMHHAEIEAEADEAHSQGEHGRRSIFIKGTSRDRIKKKTKKEKLNRDQSEQSIQSNTSVRTLK